ncbi:hypothetical protein AWB94_31260 [Mycolicibacterium canariasense]|nr:hypothetical protein AWB94_31260 [Mycolicibacterium canariasense]
MVTMRPQPVRVVGGQFVGEFEPGPVLLKNPEGQQFYITVPDADANLGDLIATAVAFPPDTSAEALAAAVTTYLEDNPPAADWTALDNKPAFVAEGATQAAARSAIGAGTSNLTIGTTAGTAKAGDYQPAAADISDATAFGEALVTAPDKLTARDAIDAASKRKARTALAEGTLKGGNITVKPASASWAGLWSEWDWTNWIQPQVDRAIKLGLNAIRIIGAPQVVLTAGTGSGADQITQATYDARWKQLAQYCLENGLRLYPCLNEKWAFYNGTTYIFQDATATTCITTTAAILAAYENVMGFDLFQEGSGSSDGLVLADVLALYSAVRAAAPGVKLTTSSSSGNFGTAAQFWTDSTSLSYTAWVADGGADFVDIHIYLEGVLASDLDGFIKRTGKPLMIGEFGADQSQAADANRVARYTSARQAHSRTGVLGSFVWAMADQGTTDALKAGVWDNTGFVQGSAPLSTTSGKRTALVAELAKFPSAPTPATPHRSPNLMTPEQANPTATTSGWATGANTYLTATSEGLAVAATAAGNVQASTTPTNGIPVLPSTPYVATVKVLASQTYAAKPVSLQIDWYTSSNVYITTSPLTRAIDSPTSPIAISVARTSPSNAAFAVVTFRGYGFAANENHLLINCSLRQYNAGDLEATSYPTLPAGDPRLFGAPSGALWTSIDRTQVVISGSLGLLTSGTPRAVLGGFALPTLVTGLKFLTGSTAAVSPTHWWVVATDASGVVLAVSADQGSAAIAASSVITVPFATPTVLPAGNVYFHLMVAAGTVPTLAGISGLLNSPTIAPVFSGASTATGQTTPPAVGDTLGAPTSQSGSVFWCWAY